MSLAVIQNISQNKRGFLNSIAIGILLFLIITIFSHIWEQVLDSFKNSLVNNYSKNDRIINVIAMTGGIAIGLFGLVMYENRYVKKQQKQQSYFTYPKRKEKEIEQTNKKTHHNSYTATRIYNRTTEKEIYKRQKTTPQLINHEKNIYNLSVLIATGIGFHNFSEGLLFGQLLIAGSLELPLLLIIGFASHNALMGIGIACPLIGLKNKPKLGSIITLGLISGGPMFLGTIIGTLWVSNTTVILFMSIACGTVVYVFMFMYNLGCKLISNNLMTLGIFFGLCIGFITNLIITLILNNGMQMKM